LSKSGEDISFPEIRSLTFYIFRYVSHAVVAGIRIIVWPAKGTDLGSAGP